MRLKEQRYSQIDLGLIFVAGAIAMLGALMMLGVI